MQVGETLKGCKIDSAYHEWLRIAVLKKNCLFGFYFMYKIFAPLMLYPQNPFKM